MRDGYEMIKKICLLGDPGVGKTSLIRRYVLDQFDDSYLSTMGAKVTKKVIEMEHNDPDIKVRMNLMIWDVAGQKEYFQFHEMYLKGMEGVLLVCDVTRRATADSMKRWVSTVSKSAGNVPIIFLVNKIDLMDSADFDVDELEREAVHMGIPLYRTSAKTGENVQKVFPKMGEMLLRRWVRKKFKK